MTAFLFTAAWERSAASDSALLVLMAIAEAADATGRATVEQRAIAARTRLHVATVARAIRVLEDLGELAVEAPKAGRKAATYAVKLRLDAAPSFDLTEYDNEIPTGPHAALDGLSGTEGPDGAEGVEPPLPDDAPVPPVAGGGTPEPEIPDGPLAGFAWRAPKAPDVGKAVAAMMPPPKRPVPSHLPPTDVGQVLAALGVKPDLRGPLFWWRSEHKDVLAALLEDLGLPSADALVVRIENNGVRVEVLNSLRDLATYGGLVR